MGKLTLLIFNVAIICIGVFLTWRAIRWMKRHLLSVISKDKLLDAHDDVEEIIVDDMVRKELESAREETRR